MVVPKIAKETRAKNFIVMQASVYVGDKGGLVGGKVRDFQRGDGDCIRADVQECKGVCIRRNEFAEPERRKLFRNLDRF